MSIAKKVTNIIKEIDRDGHFNGVEVDFEKEGIWHKEYAIFLASFELDIDMDDSPYIEITVNDRQLVEDFKQFLLKQLPKGTTIQHWGNCSEWEICGPNYKEYYEEIQDGLEEVCSNTGKHKIYEDVINKE